MLDSLIQGLFSGIHSKPIRTPYNKHKSALKTQKYFSNRACTAVSITNDTLEILIALSFFWELYHVLTVFLSSFNYLPGWRAALEAVNTFNSQMSRSENMIVLF